MQRARRAGQTPVQRLRRVFDRFAARFSAGAPASANVAAMIGEATLVPPIVTQPERSVAPSLTGVES